MKKKNQDPSRFTEKNIYIARVELGKTVKYNSEPWRQWKNETALAHGQ